MRQLGELRMGKQVLTGGTDKNGNPKSRPEKLKTWRLTSPDRALLEAAAVIYGGTVEPWQSPTGPEFEIITQSSEIEVIVSERDLMMRYEEWSAAGLQKDCDGENCRKADGKGGYVNVPCSCTEDSGDCKGVMRFSVILPNLPGLGEWKVESHGTFASLELPGMVRNLIRLYKQGQMAPMLLGIEEREIKKPGAPTKRFIVPYLKLKAGVAFGSLMGLPGYVSAPALEAPSAPALPAATKEADPYEAVKAWMLNNGVNKDIWTAWKRDGVTLDNLEDLMNQGTVRGIAEISQAVAEIIVANQRKGSQEGV